MQFLTISVGNVVLDAKGEDPAEILRCGIQAIESFLSCEEREVLMSCLRKPLVLEHAEFSTVVDTTQV